MKNNEQFEKRKIHAEQKIKLLLNNPKFLSEVKSLRTKWQIPTDGFRDNQELIGWERWLFEVDDKYHREEWPKVLERLMKLQEERKIAEYEKEKLIAAELNPRNQFLKDLRELANRFDIYSDSWITFVVRSFLLTNQVMSPPVTDLAFVPNFKKKQIQITINQYTTIRDMQHIWPRIKELQAKMEPKMKKMVPMRNLDRNLKALKLKDDGLTRKEIADALSETDAYDYTYIPKIIKRTKKKIDKS